MADKIKNKILISCPDCKTNISKSWLLLGLPWSTYTCSKCNSTIGGTILRTIVIWIVGSVLCFVLISVIKYGLNPVLLIPSVVLLLFFLFTNLPLQVKKIDKQIKGTDEVETPKIEESRS